MTIAIGNSGSNTITGVTVGDAGVNRVIREVWIGEGGSNRLVFAGINLLGLDPMSAVISPADASATYTLTNAGLEQATGSANNMWLISGVASDYEVMATLDAGALTSGSTGSWLSLGTTRAWNVTRTSNVIGTNSATLTVQVRLASSGTVLATVSVVITAEVA